MSADDTSSEVGGDIHMDVLSRLISRGYGGSKPLPTRGELEDLLRSWGKAPHTVVVDRLLRQLEEVPAATFPGLEKP